MKNIILSPKHGLNPSVGVCFYCAQDDGTVILPGHLKEDAQAPRRAVWTKEPCPKCADLMKQGIMLIEVQPGETGDNPARTGRQWVLKQEAVERLITPPAKLAQVIQNRVAFIFPETARALGLDEKPTP